MGESTITTPIGYRKKVVLSKKGRTTARDVNQLLQSSSHSSDQNQKPSTSEMYMHFGDKLAKNISNHLLTTMLTITYDKPKYEFLLHIIQWGF